MRADALLLHTGFVSRSCCDLRRGDVLESIFAILALGCDDCNRARSGIGAEA